MKKLLLLAFAAFAFAACSDDDKMPTPPQLETISFSEVELEFTTDTCGVKLWQRM